MNRFRVLQFNMQFGQTWDDADPDNAPVDLAQAIAAIKAQDADIILLQEVEHAHHGGLQLNPPPNYTRLCAALAGYDSHFSYPAADPRELPFGIGLAIFSRTPLDELLCVDIPSPPVEFEFDGRVTTPTDRLLIGARTVIDGQALQIYTTHLLAFFMLKTSSEVHREQRDQVAALLKASGDPTVLGGDFNTRNHRSLTGQFAEAGYRSVQTEALTWRRMPFVLDHLFFNAGLQPLSHRVIPTLSSDHHLLVADFAFTP